MHSSMKIFFRVITLLLFISGCTTQTSKLQNQVIEDEEALINITTDSVSGPIGLFQVIARAGQFQSHREHSVFKFRICEIAGRNFYFGGNSHS